jgi:hypothetical protein
MTQQQATANLGIESQILELQAKIKNWKISREGKAPDTQEAINSAISSAELRINKMKSTATFGLSTLATPPPMQQRPTATFSPDSVADAEIAPIRAMSALPPLPQPIEKKTLGRNDQANPTTLRPTTTTSESLAQYSKVSTPRQRKRKNLTANGIPTKEYKTKLPTIMVEVTRSGNRQYFEQPVMKPFLLSEIRWQQKRFYARNPIGAGYKKWVLAEKQFFRQHLNEK